MSAGPIIKHLNVIEDVCACKIASFVHTFFNAFFLQTAEKRVSITWAKRLKRVFNIDIKTCDKCGGDVRIVYLHRKLPQDLH